MRVHEVVAARRVLSLGAQHLAYEGAQLGGQVCLGQTLVRPGRDVADENSGQRLEDWWLLR